MRYKIQQCLVVVESLSSMCGMSLGVDQCQIVNFPISVNQSTKQNFGKQMPRGGIEHYAMRIINTTPLSI